MDPMLLLSAGAGIGQGLLNYASQRSANAQNYAIMKMQNEYNMNMFDQQYQNNVKLWQMNNKYNSPVKQMERLRAAGLNPSLLMGNNATAPASAASAPTAAPAAGATMHPAMFQFSDVFKNLADSLKLISETKAQNINNSYLDERNRSEIQKNFAYAANQLQESRNHPIQRAYWESVCKNLSLEYMFNEQSFNVRYQGLELQNEMLAAQKTAAEEQGKMYAAQKAYNDSLTSLNITQGSYQARQLQAAIAATLSQASVNNALSGLYVQDATLYDERKKNLIADTLVKNMHANGLKLSNEQTYKMLPHVIEGIRLQNQYLKTQNTQGLMNMFFKPFELGQSMFKSVGGAGAAVLGSKGFKAKYNDDYWNQWSPTTSR